MPASRRPLQLIVNPASGGKPGSGPPATDDPSRLEPDALLAALREGGLDAALHVLTEQEDPGEVAAGSVESEEDVVVAGGDGTVGRIASVLVRTETTLGIVPTGSFNNASRGFGIPQTLDAALDVIIRGQVASVDTGLAWPIGSAAHPDEDPPPEAHTFLEAAGAGLEAAGFSAVDQAERHGLRAGLRAGWLAVRQLRRGEVRLEIDGREIVTHAPAVTVCNGPYHGFGFVLVPDADPTDGRLDVAIFAGMTALEAISHLVAVARGRVRRDPKVRTLRARQVVIHRGRRPRPVHADGDPIGDTPVAIRVSPGSLRIFR